MNNIQNDKIDNKHDDRQTIFVIEELSLSPNGIVKSVLSKVRTLEDATGCRPWILVARLCVDLGAIEYIYKTGSRGVDRAINKDTRVFGVFNYFQKSYPFVDNLDVIEYSRDGDGLERVETEKDVYEVRDGGKLVKIEYFTGPEFRLRFIEFFDGDGLKTKTYIFDDTGRVSVMQIWSLENQNFFHTEYYYTTERKCCIVARYKWVEDYNEEYANIRDKMARVQNQLVSYTILDDAGDIMGELKSHEELVALCLARITAENGGKKYLIVDESACYSGYMSLFKRANIAKAAVFHARFLVDPYDMKSPPQAFFRHICERRDDFDGLVFLTRGAKSDFAKKYGFSRSLYDIGHPYPYDITPVPFDGRDKKRVVFVGRFDPSKRVDLSIEIFKSVVEAVPDATFDLWGFGWPDWVEGLEKRIADLGLTDSVKIMGYTNNPPAVFAGAAASVLTSESEGFALSLSESICNGCPPFAFDVKYGPPSIIKNGVNGFLFKEGDKAAFVKKMTDFLSDEDYIRKISAQCYDTAPEYGKEAFVKKWVAFEDAMYNKLQ